MRKELTHAELARLLHYDLVTGKFTWLTTDCRRMSAGDAAGCVMNTGYVKLYILGAQYTGHRVAWFYVTGAWPLFEVDHINGERADNRFVNLREASSTENKRNAKTPCTNTSGFKGVYRARAANKWRAACSVNNRYVHLGHFDSPEEASAAYEAFARKTFREFYKPSRATVSALSFGITE